MQRGFRPFKIHRTGNHRKHNAGLPTYFPRTGSSMGKHTFFKDISFSRFIFSTPRQSSLVSLSSSRIIASDICSLSSSISLLQRMDFPPGLDMDFLLAARRGDIQRLQSIVAENENVPFASLTSPNDRNALHWAAMEGQTSICRFLIEVLNFNINATDENGETPLFQALLGNCRSTTIFLIDNGADVTHCNTFGDTPLHCVADSGIKEMMQILISEGADICATSQRGMPLHFAARGGNRDVLKYILELTEDPHPKISSLDLSPLFSAMFGDSIECVDLLLKAGADPNYQCYEVTPLRCDATAPAPDEGLIKCLLKAVADPNVPDYVSDTPLDHAALLGHREVVELLFPLTSLALHLILSGASVE